MTATFDETLGYLEANYLTLPHLAVLSGVEPSRLQALIAAGLLPAHSHEATFSLSVYAPINGAHPVAGKRVGYFHPDLVELAREADKLARDLGLEAATTLVRDRHDATVAEAAALEAGSPAHRALADRAWSAWRDGTLGVCLRRFSTKHIVRKLAATERMKAMLALAAAHGDRAVDRRALGEAAEAYADVTGPFGPHERDGSTRALVYEPALALAARIDAAEPALATT